MTSEGPCHFTSNLELNGGRVLVPVSNSSVINTSACGSLFLGQELIEFIELPVIRRVHIVFVK